MSLKTFGITRQRDLNCKLTGLEAKFNRVGRSYSNRVSQNCSFNVIVSGVYVGWNLYNNATIKLADGTWDNLDNLLDGYCQSANMQVVDEKSFCRQRKDNHELGEGGAWVAWTTEWLLFLSLTI
jgi:hypothetical protein